MDSPLAWHTTRKAEKGEVDGERFYFVKKDLFDGMLRDGRLVRVVVEGKTSSGLAWEEVKRCAARGFHAAVGMNVEEAL